MNPVDHPHGGGNHQHIGKKRSARNGNIHSNMPCRQGFHDLKIRCTRSKGRSYCCSENWSVAWYSEDKGLRDWLNRISCTSDALALHQCTFGLRTARVK